MTATATRQAAKIEAWLRIFHPLPGTVVELRALEVHGKRALGHCYGDPGELARRAVELDEAGARGLYFTLNPLRPELAGAAASAKKVDVVRRHWLGVDVDPERAPGTNSTEAEREGAWRVLDRARGLLGESGLGGVVVGDSGNGWHACYPVDLPADDDAQALVRSALKGLQERCGEPEARIDVSVHDGPRIWKLYGTRTRKGPPSADRPQRWARLVEDGPWGAPRPWSADAGARNAESLRLLVARWQRVEEMRRGRPGDEAGLPAAERARRYVARMPPAVAGQRGHDQTYEVAQVLARGFALPRSDSWPILCEYSDRCQPPWSERELLHKIESAERDSRLPLGYLLCGAPPANGHHANGHSPPANGAARPRGEPPAPAQAPPEEWEQPIPLNAPPAVPPFPIDVLPEPVRRYVEELAWATNAPVDFAAAPSLAIAAGAIGASRRLAITRSHHQPACLFAAVIGRPGSGKSTPLDFAIAPMVAAEHRFRAAWERAKEEWGQEDAETRGPRPALRRCLVDDTTTEALARILGENPRGLLMARDELAALVTGMNQYKDGGKGSDRQTYLKIWSGGTITVDRNKLDGVPLVVRRPCVSIVGTIQPGVIEWLRGEQKGDRPPPDDGFLDRFLLSHPAERDAVGEQWREVSQDAERDWRDVLDKLLQLEQRAAPDGDRLPELLPLGADAKLAWGRLTQAHADELNSGEVPDWLRGAWTKLVPGYAGRLALVLQLLRWACVEGAGDYVDARSVDAAFALVDYHKAHARKVYQAMGCDPRAGEARHVLNWVGRKEVAAFTRRDAYRDLRHSFKAPESLDRPLQLLVAHGYLRASAADGPRTGRKPTDRYEVNPLWERRKSDASDKT